MRNNAYSKNYLCGYKSNNIEDIKEQLIYAVFPYREIYFFIISFFLISIPFYFNIKYGIGRGNIFAITGFRFLIQIIQIVMFYFLIKSLSKEDKITYKLSFFWNTGFSGFIEVGESPLPGYCHYCNKKTENFVQYSGSKRVDNYSEKDSDILKNMATYKEHRFKVFVCKEHEDTLKWKDLISVSGKLLTRNIFYYREAMNNPINEKAYSQYKEIANIEKTFSSLNNFEDNIKEIFLKIAELKETDRKKYSIPNSIARTIKIIFMVQALINYWTPEKIYPFILSHYSFYIQAFLIISFVVLFFLNDPDKCESAIRSEIDKIIKSYEFSPEKEKLVYQILLPEKAHCNQWLYKK